MRTCFILFILFGLLACQDEKAALLKQIQDQELAIGHQPAGKPELDAVMASYRQYLSAEPGDCNGHRERYLRAAGWFYQLDDAPYAAGLFTEMTQGLGACPPLQAAEMDSLLAHVVDEAQGKIDTAKAHQYLAWAESVYSLYPQDTANAKVWEKAGTVAKFMGRYELAMQFYQYMLDRYPQTGAAGMAAFLKAFTLDNDLQQEEAAKTAYQAFLAQYPNHDFADDAQFLLDNIGKSEEEMIRALQEQ